MKSHTTILLELYRALLRDAEALYAQDSDHWSRDFTRLHTSVESRGLPFLTVTLPAVGKWFDFSIANGHAHGCYEPGMARSPRRPYPRLFSGLFARVFDANGDCRKDLDETVVALLRQLLYAAKKYRIDCKPSYVYKTVEEFFNVEKGLRNPTLEWDSDLLRPSRARSLSLHDRDRVQHSDAPELPLSSLYRDEDDTRACPRLLDHVQRVADYFCGQFPRIPLELLRPKHGPGVVSDTKKGMKYQFPNWPEKLEATFGSADFASANYSLYLESRDDGLIGLTNHEPPSRLAAVPKTQKGPRLIASEPTAHQWVQQAVARHLYDVVRGCWLGNAIDFFDQSPNQRLALEASNSGRLATIDLSSASDRLSCWAVERIFRAAPQYLGAFHACRTRWIFNPVDKKSDRFCKLKKFAPMGSALTFPVQSIVYAIIGIAVVDWHSQDPTWDWSKRLGWASRLVRVFGDDIIVPDYAYPELIDVLTHIGLEVNISKSFVGCKFHESCGVDAYNGVDVTPAYFLEAPDSSDPRSVISAVASSNNFHKKGWWNAAAYITSLFPKVVRQNLLVERCGGDAFGLESFCGRSLTHLSSRWNKDLQKQTYRAYQPRAKVSTSPYDGNTSLFQFFLDNPEPTVKWKAGFQEVTDVRLPRVWLALE